MITPYINFELKLDDQANRPVSSGGLGTTVTQQLLKSVDGADWPISEVIVGTTPHPELSKSSTERLLLAYGVKAEVKRSRQRGF
jgi:hypothetical protein